MADIPSLAATVGDYQTVVTIFTASTGGWEKFLNADSRRWCLRISYGRALGLNSLISPGPPPLGFSPFGISTETIEVKFRDAPSWCAGEWYVFDAPGTELIIWESLYVR